MRLKESVKRKKIESSRPNNLMSNMKTKKKSSKNTMPKKKTRVSSGNLTNQQPMI